MISVTEARASLLSLVSTLGEEDVPLRQAAGRILARPVAAKHDQPPFAASAMDGYAVSTVDLTPGQKFEVIGEAAAGHPFAGTLNAGQAVRIFTGAPTPEGAVRVVIQEDVIRDGTDIILKDDLDHGLHIRPSGGDFTQGSSHAPTGPLGSRDIALLAAMGHVTLPVRRRPIVAVLMTGDELRLPGQRLAQGQIVASNGFGLAAMFEAAGALSRMLPIARDSEESLRTAIQLSTGADLLVTIGGASVGDHDLVAGVLASEGIEMAFHKIAMRPGKPLMAGRLHKMPVVGLPGNPVSAMVCGTIFVLPMLARMLGQPVDVPVRQVPLANDVPKNGPREHYMRASIGPDGRVTIADRQDSSLLSVLTSSNALVVRPQHDAARKADAMITTIDLPN